MAQDIITIFHGPQHPGITGNMSVELDLLGETIKRAETHVGYLHRGFEKMIERRTVLQAFTIVCRICVPEPDPNEENFARGVEELMGLEVPEKAKWLRTMVLEMARLQAQMLWFAGQGGSLGHYISPQWAVADRDLILDLFEELTGGRVYHMYITPGGVRRDLPEGFLGRLGHFLDYLESRLPEYDNMLLRNPVFLERARGVGIIDPATAREYGVVGPNLRACGFMNDIRKDEPYEMYGEVDFIVPTETSGDVYGRAMVRRAEIEQSISILRQIIRRMPAEKEIMAVLPKNHRKWEVPKGDTLVKTESARGEYSYYMVGDGTDKLRRVQVKGPSAVHAITLLEEMLVDSQLSDVAMIMNSLGTNPPEIER
ncbi:MAG: hypothetical protein JXR86_10485 [Spirochaetales bacterium]|nr:hypothetical protein [Spirochaetales bacterium]